MDIINYRQCAVFANERIKDPCMRETVFGIKEISFRDIKGVGALYKLARVQFVIVYLKWLNTSRSVLNAYRSSHFKKINSVLFSLYKTQKLDLDVVIFVLSEVQRDIMEQKENSFFYGLLCGDVFCEFSKLYGIIHEWLRSVQTSEDNKETLLHYLTVLLQSADGIANASIDKNNKTLSLYDKVYSLSDVIVFDENGDAFLLTNRISVGNRTQFEYVSVDELHTKTITKE